MIALVVLPKAQTPDTPSSYEAEQAAFSKLEMKLHRRRRIRAWLRLGAALRIT